MVDGYQQVAVDFVANNPGLTLFHCHQQLHMDFGFMSLFDYAGQRCSRSCEHRLWTSSGAAGSSGEDWRVDRPAGTAPLWRARLGRRSSCVLGEQSKAAAKRMVAPLQPDAGSCGNGGVVAQLSKGAANDRATARVSSLLGFPVCLKSTAYPWKPRQRWPDCCLSRPRWLTYRLAH